MIVARQGGHDLIVGVGGSSSLDTAKGASVMVINSGKVLDYVGVDLISKRAAQDLDCYDSA